MKFFHFLVLRIWKPADVDCPILSKMKTQDLKGRDWQKREDHRGKTLPLGREALADLEISQLLNEGRVDNHLYGFCFRLRNILKVRGGLGSESGDNERVGKDRVH